MATTPNYGWVTPAPTDFVTDLPADFEVFADAVDADLSGLLGGTTGQVLLKDSNADHDFSWGTPASGGWTLITSTTLNATGTVTFNSIPQTYKHLAVLFENIHGSTNNAGCEGRVNNTDLSRTFVGRRLDGATQTLVQWNSINNFGYISGSDLYGVIHWTSNATPIREKGNGLWIIYNYTTSVSKYSEAKCAWVSQASGNWRSSELWGNLGNHTTAVTRLDLVASAGTMTTGTISLYGIS